MHSQFELHPQQNLACAFSFIGLNPIDIEANFHWQYCLEVPRRAAAIKDRSMEQNVANGGFKVGHEVEQAVLYLSQNCSEVTNLLVKICYKIYSSH